MNADEIKHLRAKIEKARYMVSALCKPRHAEGARKWVLSIPARPDYDPDIVIADGLRAGNNALDEIERLRDWRKRASVIMEPWPEMLDEEGEDLVAEEIRALLAERVDNEPLERERELEQSIRDAPCPWTINADQYPYGTSKAMCDNCDCWKRDALRGE